MEGICLYTKKQLRLAELGLLIVTIIWGSGFVVVKSATGSLEPAAIVALRFAIATILMCIVFFPRLKRIDKSCIKAGALAGFLYFLAFYLQTLGAKYTTAGKNAFLTAIYVVLVPFLYWIIQKQRPDLYNVSAAFLCIIGIGLLSLNADFSINQGDAFSLLGGVGFTAQIVATAILTQKQDPILLSVTQFGFATIFAAVTSLLTEPIPTHLAPDTLTYILYLGVFSTMIALLLQTVLPKIRPRFKRVADYVAGVRIRLHLRNPLSARRALRAYSRGLCLDFWGDAAFGGQARISALRFPAAVRPSNP